MVNVVERAGPHWSRTAGGIAALVAVVAFAFGVGNFTDLKTALTGETVLSFTTRRVIRNSIINSLHGVSPH